MPMAVSQGLETSELVTLKIQEEGEEKSYLCGMEKANLPIKLGRNITCELSPSKHMDLGKLRGGEA